MQTFQSRTAEQIRVEQIRAEQAFQRSKEIMLCHIQDFQSFLFQPFHPFHPFSDIYCFPTQLNCFNPDVAASDLLLVHFQPTSNSTIFHFLSMNHFLLEPCSYISMDSAATLYSLYGKHGKLAIHIFCHITNCISFSQ